LFGLSKQFLIFFGIGILAVVVAVIVILSATKGAHLELQGKIIKIRTGALSDDDSIAVLDFRVRNISDVPFVVREVDVTLDKPNGSSVQGANVSRGDLKQLFQFNRFLGDQYNDSLSIKDTIPPHGAVDRMVAARFDVKNEDLEAAKAIHLSIQDMGGALFETSRSVK
jgi:hypothetical protein